MLSTKNLTKIYKAKGGVETYALNNVSITFPEKGMVFLLGKSGSGKSTLLNVCGGLDDPTSGEVIVKGRSSKDFTASDFDSYRNTFIGFIFQEYNILNEFTVEQNIALALELQGKKKDKAAIEALLEQVDLKDFAKRKPNTLSGGQKQRIAIARALIKNPEIIMADEPTGALDSNTGKQVFDTLKKLSLEKLVIVVSHDREFAEQYGDRIIELKDGQILSDYHKVKEDGLDVSENVSVLGENTICVQDGTTLSKDDEKYIIEFLKKTQGNVTITNGVREQETFKANSRITDDNKIEVFREIDDNEIIEKEYTKEESRFIKSKLPAKHAFKIGASGLKTKPFRLVLTILLSVIAFVMFGLVSTFMDYNGEEVFGNTLKNKEEIHSIVLQKRYKSRVTYYQNDVEQSSYDRDNDALISEADFNNFKQQFGNDIYPAVQAGYGGETFVVDDNSNAYYQNKIFYYAYLPNGNSLKNAELQGNYPLGNNEVAITKYTAKALIEGKSQSEGITAQTTEGQLIGKNISINGNSYKIVGIVDTKMDNIPSEYNDLQDKTMGTADPEVIRNYQTYLQDSMHATLFVSDSLLRSKTKYYQGSSYWNDIQARYNVTYPVNYETSWIPYTSLGLYPNKKVNGLAWSFFDKTKNTVEEGEILITASILRDTFLGFPNYDDIYQEEEELNRQEWSLNDEERNLDSELNSQVCDIYYMIQLWAENKAIPSNNSWLYSVYNDYLHLDNEAFMNQYGEYSFNLSELKEIYIYVEDDIPSTDPVYDYHIRYKDIVERRATIAEKRLEIEAKKQYSEYLNKLRDKVLYGYYWDSDLSETVYLTLEERQVAIGQFVNILFEDEKYYELEIQAYSWDFNGGVGAKKNMKIVGIVYSDSENSISDFILASEKDYNEISEIAASYQQGNTYKEVVETKYEDKGDGVYQYIVVPYDHTQGLTDEIVKSLRLDDNDVFYEPVLSVYDAYYMLNELVESLSTILLYVGLVLAAFSMLLLANFISISISAKKKEIGILRAVGARSVDIFKIFFSESGIISGICFVISLIATCIGCSYISSISAQKLGISLFTITPLTITLLLVIAVVTAIIATFFPVFSAARKKPVESIRAL